MDDWMNPPKGERMNKRQIANCFGMQLREVQSWLDRGAPAVRVGSEQHEWIIDPAKFWRFVLDETKRQAIAERNSPRAGFVSAKTRHKLASAIAVEQRNAEAAANLVTTEQAARALRESNDIVRRHLRAVPAAVAEAIALESDPVTVEHIMEDAIQAAMHAISTEGVPNEQ